MVVVVEKIPTVISLRVELYPLAYRIGKTRRDVEISIARGEALRNKLKQAFLNRGRTGLNKVFMDRLHLAVQYLNSFTYQL